MSRRAGQILALLSVLALIAVVTGYQFFGQQRLQGDVLDGGYEGAQVCGNSTIESTEQCDDGNVMAGDGCSELCQNEVPAVTAVCGNGTVEDNEQCDDANALSGDGCSATCQKEAIPVAVCGNGIVEVGEQCDDANVIAGDGCSDLCQKEVVPAVCGNTAVEDGEQCDDGNVVAGDGCDALCQKEELPVAVCGNGVLDTGEQCDDGNILSGDGCSELCGPEVKVTTEPPVTVPPVVTPGEETDPTTGVVIRRLTASYGEQATLDALLVPQHVPNFRTNVRWTADLQNPVVVQIADPNATTTSFVAPSQDATLKFVLELVQNETFTPVAYYIFTVSNPILLKADANRDGIYTFEDLVDLLQRWESYGDQATQVLAVILSRYEQK